MLLYRKAGMLTHSKAKKLNQQTRCPISLETFDANTIIFVHDNTRYNAIELQHYLILNPNAKDPITRRNFTISEIKYLNALCNNGKMALFGEEAVAEQKTQQEEKNSLYYLEGELKTLLSKFHVLMTDVGMRYYRDDLRDLNINLQEVIYDVRQYDNAFDDMLPVLIQFVKELRFFNGDVNKDIINILKHGSVQENETSSDSESGSDMDISDNEEPVNYRINSEFPHYAPVNPPPFNLATAASMMQPAPPFMTPPPYTRYSTAFNGQQIPPYAVDFLRNVRI